MRLLSALVEFDEDIDALGLLCPLPVLRLAKRMRAAKPGAVVRLQADDPAAVIDVPHYCTESGNVLVTQIDYDGAQHYYVKKS